MLEYKKLIIGCPTWHIGELQDDWDFIYEKYKELDFNGITAAFFGCGDQIGYPANFLDAIGMLAEPFMKKGGKLIGSIAFYKGAKSYYIHKKSNKIVEFNPCFLSQCTNMYMHSVFPLSLLRFVSFSSHFLFLDIIYVHDTDILKRNGTLLTFCGST